MQMFFFYFVCLSNFQFKYILVRICQTGERLSQIRQLYPLLYRKRAIEYDP